MWALLSLLIVKLITLALCKLLKQSNKRNITDKIKSNGSNKINVLKLFTFTQLKTLKKK